DAGVGGRRRARRGGGDPARLVPERVEERVYDQVAIAFADARAAAPRVEDAQVLAVRGHHALRLSGGARREDHVGEVVGLDRGRALAGRALGHGGAARDERVPRGGTCGAAAQRHDLAQGGQLLTGERGDV